MATASLTRPASHPFYERLSWLLEECGFDEFVEQLCKPFYAATLGRPGVAPGIYFRMLLVGYFEGIDSERGIAWRVGDSLSLRWFLRIGLDESTPDDRTHEWNVRTILDCPALRLNQVMQRAQKNIVAFDPLFFESCHVGFAQTVEAEQ